MSFIDPYNAGAAGPVPSLTPDALTLGLGADQSPGTPQALRQAGDIMQQRQEGLAPARAQAMQAANAPLPQPPQLQQPPKLTREDAQQQDADQAWLTAAMFLGTLGGALTRRPLTNALAAFTGTVEGFKERNDADFKRNLEIWDRENKRVEEANSTALKQYETILKSRELSFEQKQFALQIKAQELDDDAMMHALQTGNPEVVAQLHDQRSNYGRSLGAAGAALKQQALQALAKQSAQQFVQSDAGEALAQRVAAGAVPMPPSTQFGRGLDGVMTYREMMGRVLQINPNYTANTFNYNRSLATGEGGTLGRAGGNIELVMQSAQPVIQLAANAADKIPQTRFPVVNRMIQSGIREFGDENERQFAIAHLELEGILARAINSRSSVIPVSFWNSAREALDKTTSKEGYYAQLHYIEDLVQRENAAVGRAQRKEPIPAVTYPSTATSTSVPAAARDVAGRAGAAVTNAAGPDIASRFPQTGESTSQVLPGYSRGRGLPAGWSLTPAPAPAAPSPDMPILQPGQ